MPISTGGRATASPHAFSHIHCLLMPPHLSPFIGCQKVGLTEKAPSLTSALLWLGYKQLILTCGLLNDCWIAENSRKKKKSRTQPFTTSSTRFIHRYVPHAGTSQLPNVFPRQAAPSMPKKKKVSVAGLNMLQITSSTAEPGSC